MNSKRKAIDSIEKFLKSDEKCMLITGTHQYEKHILVMAILNQYYKNTNILFRTNGVGSAFSTPDILGKLTNKKYKAGEKFYINNNIYTVDSFSSKTTWDKTSEGNRFAIVYPIDSMVNNKVSIEGITELFDRELEKIFLVTWTDQRDHDFSQLSRYIDKRVTFDAEEEDKEYHKRVLEFY